MIDAVTSEWIKLRSVTSTVVLFIAVAGVSIGFGLLATIALPLDDPDVIDQVGDRLALVLTGVGTSLTIFSVIGALLVTQEFRFSTIRVTLVAVPVRSRVLVAKAILLGVVAAAVGAVMVAVTTAIGASILAWRGFPVDFSEGGTVRVLVGAVVLAVLYTLFGLAVGSIVRAQPLAIVLVIVVPIVEGILGAIFPSVGKWLPFTASNALVSVDPDPDFLGPWIGAAYFLVVILVLLAIGAALLHRRDA